MTNLSVCQFKIVHQNIRSVRKNFDLLLAELEATSLDPDIIVLSEVWIMSNETCLYDIPHYILYANCNDGYRAGGVIIYVKQNIKVLNCHNVQFNTADVIKININVNDQDFHIFAFYRLHLFSKEMFIDELGNYLTIERNLRFNKNVIFIGDLNINLLENKLTTDEYLNVLALSGLECMSIEATRVMPGFESCLDHVFSKVSSKDMIKVHVDTVHANITDHAMIVVSVQVRGSNRDKNVITEPTDSNLSRIDYVKLNNLLDTADWSDVYNKTDASLAFDTFFLKFNQMVLDAKVLVIKKQGSKKIKPWMNNFLAMRVKIKNKLYKNLKLHPNNDKLKSYYKKYRDKLQMEIQNTKMKYYSARFVNVKGNSKALWNEVKAVTGQNVNKSDVEFLEVGDQKIYGVKEMTNAFNDHFLSIVDTLDIKNDISEDVLKMHFRDLFRTKSTVESMFLRPVRLDDLTEVINSLKNNSSPGIDGISSLLIKNVYPKIVNVLLFLVNLSFQTGVFPDRLKEAVVIPVHKSGSKSNLNNFRPISLLPVLSKVFEKLMKQRLVEFLKKNKFFSKNQFGFSEGKSTEDALLNFMTHIISGLNQGNRVSGVFLDIKKAFDTVNHKILLSKLFQCGIRGLPYKWFESYLEGRKQCVKINSICSEMKIIKHSVPQGSVLGAILFLVYINDLCNANLLGCITSFADDTALSYCRSSWSEIERDMNHDLLALKWWFSVNSMTLSPEKTKYVNFSLRFEHDFLNPIRYKCLDCLVTNSNCAVKCAVVNRVTSIKYLGLFLDQECNWKEHILKLKNKLNNSLRLFYFLNNLGIPEDVLRMIYFSTVHSRIEYALTFWGAACDVNVKPIFVIQKNFIRVILKKSKTEQSFPLFVKLNILPLKHLFVYKILKLFYNQSGNYLVNTDSYRNRLRNANNVFVPRPFTTFFTLSYNFLAPRMFNTLPNEIKNCHSLKKFNSRLKKWLLTLQNIDFLLKIET